MMKTKPGKSTIRASIAAACIGISAFGITTVSTAQDPSAQPLTPNLMTNTRNFADLNAANFNPETNYTVPAPGPDATQFRFKLKGYVFGLRMIKANYTGYYDQSTYSVYTDIKTSGLGALLKKMEIWAVTRGRHSSVTGLTPDWHVQQNMDKKNRRVEMNYDNEQRKVDVDIVPPLYSQGTPPATPEERYQAEDTISAILTMMMTGTQLTGQMCNGSVPVFDSKQHYNLRMERAGTKRVKYDGDKVEAIRCHVYYEPVSGFDPEDLPEVEEESTPVKVYFIKMDDLGLYVPVRFTYKISSIKAVIKLDDLTVVTSKKK